MPEPASADDAPLEEQDFETIEAAVMETERGRWFLREHARRIREAENGRIEAALARIESRLPAAPGPLRETETRIVALSVQQRLVDLAHALRESGIDETVCRRLEAQARLLVDLARRRNVVAVSEAMGVAPARKQPAA